LITTNGQRHRRGIQGKGNGDNKYYKEMHGKGFWGAKVGDNGNLRTSIFPDSISIVYFPKFLHAHFVP
jgi:hypothetical protein